VPCSAPQLACNRLTAPNIRPIAIRWHYTKNEIILNHYNSLLLPFFKFHQRYKTTTFYKELRIVYTLQRSLFDPLHDPKSNFGALQINSNGGDDKQCNISGNFFQRLNFWRTSSQVNTRRIAFQFILFFKKTFLIIFWVESFFQICLKNLRGHDFFYFPVFFYKFLSKECSLYLEINRALSTFEIIMHRFWRNCQLTSRISLN